MSNIGKDKQRWLTPGVRGIGAASLLSDLGHEVPTSLLPRFLTSTLGAPAAALGLIEGLSDGLAGIMRLAGGALADDPARRRNVAVGGYAATAIMASAVGASQTVWQVGILRAGGWAARGLRGPARNALLADAVDPSVYGRAYGFERAMDNLGAIGGPLLALALISAFSVRTAILLSVLPGLLAAAAMLYAIRHLRRSSTGERRPVRLKIKPVLQGRLRRLMLGVAAFEVGNVAATLLILRATELLSEERSADSATRVALLLYLAYNISATLSSIPAGRMSDERGPVFVLSGGVAAFLVAYATFAVIGAGLALLALVFVLAGIGIGCVETAEHSAIAGFAPADLRGSAFGLLAGIQSFGNLAASGVAGLLWTLLSPGVAFAYLAAWMAVGLVALIRAGGGEKASQA